MFQTCWGVKVNGTGVFINLDVALLLDTALLLTFEEFGVEGMEDIEIFALVPFEIMLGFARKRDKIS